MSENEKFIIWAILVVIYCITFVASILKRKKPIKDKWLTFDCVNGLICFCLIIFLFISRISSTVPLYEGFINLTIGCLLIMILDYYSDIIRDLNLKFFLHIGFRIVIIAANDVLINL